MGHRQVKLEIVQTDAEYHVLITHEGHGHAFQYEFTMEPKVGPVAFFSRMIQAMADAQHCYDRDCKFYEGVKERTSEASSDRQETD